MAVIARAFCVVIALACSGVRAQAPEALRVFSSNGLRGSLEQILTEIVLHVGRPVAFEFSTAQTLAVRLESGASVDVAILTPALIDTLIAQGKVTAESRADIARVGIGVGARPGFPAVAVRTREDLRRVLVAAESVAYGADGQSRRTNEASFERLGLWAEMQPKVRLTGPGEAPGLVADGRVDLVMTLISELVREPGVEFLGPLPAEVQTYVGFAAAIGVGARDAAAAAALIDYLRGPAFAAALAAHGLEAAGPRDGQD